MNIHDTSIRAVPVNTDAEQALLSSIFVNNDAIDQVSSFIEPQHFYDPLHGRIYTVMQQMIEAKRQVTPITIRNYLPTQDKVGEITLGEYLINLGSAAVTDRAGIRGYGIAVHEMWIRRQLLSTATEVVDLCYGMAPDKDIIASTGNLAEHVTELAAEWVRGDGKRLGHGAAYREKLKAAKQRVYDGVPIAFPEIREVLKAQTFVAGNLYGLLSSSGEGKTSLTMQLIFEALVKGHPVLFLSYDQSPDQCVEQLTAQQQEISNTRQRLGDFNDREFNAIMSMTEWIDEQPLEIVKCTNQNAAQLVGFARNFIKKVRKRGNDMVPLIVVDHIKAIATMSNDQRADEGTLAGNILTVLKAAAEQTGGPWLVLNQRNTTGMRRDNPRPIKSDIYGGEIAATPYDAVFYLYRYKPHYDARKDTISSDRDSKVIDRVFSKYLQAGGDDLAEIGMLKNRFGPVHIKEHVIFEANLTRYKSLVREEEGFL